MATEYFSAIGSAFSDSVTGIIDDPEYTLYVNVTGDDNSGQGTLAKPFKTPQRALFHLRDKFITQNGFAQIKLGAGRFVLDDAIEMRHPQGDRIGFKGQKTITYNMTDCHGYTASHAEEVADGDVDFQTQGSTAPRYYKSSIKIQDGIGDQSSQIGSVQTIEGISGEYLLVQDYSMRNDDDYDHVMWDYNLNGKTAKRSSLMGCNILYGANTDVNDVKMNMKYYNFPFQMKTTFQRHRVEGGFQSDEKSSIVRVGGCRQTAMGGRDFPTMEGVGGFLLPSDTDKYFSYSSDPLENTPETTENRNSYLIGQGASGERDINTAVLFGSTAEGHTITFSNEVAPHYPPFTHSKEFIDETNARQKVFTQPNHNSTFVTFNRMTATHVTTILVFKDKTKPGILLDGSQLGYIHDMVLEGKWQQFKQGFNHGGSTGENQALMDDHSGILVKNNGNLSYDLGKTGASLAELKFTPASSIRNDQKPISSDSVTLSNVGINGFEYGVIVENDSSANLDDIVISNCGNGIYVVNNSQATCTRSTIIGVEQDALCALDNSNVIADRTMIAHVSCPRWEIKYAIQSEDYLQRKARDNTFLPGRQVVINKSGAQAYAGITSRWRARSAWTTLAHSRGQYEYDSKGNERELELYDHKGQMTTTSIDISGPLGSERTPSLSAVKNGITGATADNDTIFSGSQYQDSDPSSGYLKAFDSRQYKWGYGSAVRLSNNSRMAFSNSSVFYTFGTAVMVANSSNFGANGSVFAMNAGVGVHTWSASHASLGHCRLFHNIDHSVEAGTGSSLDLRFCSLEASNTMGYFSGADVLAYNCEFREGVSMFVKYCNKAIRNSYLNIQNSSFQTFNANMPENNDSAPFPAPRNNYNNRELSDEAEYADDFFIEQDATSVVVQ